MLTEPGHIIFGVRTSAGSTGLFDLVGGRLEELIPVEPSQEDILTLSYGGRHTIEVTSIAINQHGQAAYLGSP